LAQAQILLALLIWAGALAGISAGREPFVTWLYHFAWWPLLLFLDGLLALKTGESWWWDRPGEFLQALGFSITIWLVFEAFNLHLLNWRYVGLEPRIWRRWPGYGSAFATVVPAILLSARLLRAAGAFGGLQVKPRQWPGWQPWFLMMGVACLTLPVSFPTYAFPLLWVAFFFLLDPWVELLGGKSLTARLLAGEMEEALCLLTAGLALGLWWELWNYPAAAKWIYTLPILNFGKIFEMPALGYLGFPPFALEGAVMYTFLKAVDRRLGAFPTGRRRFWLTQAAFWLIMFAAIDARTVLSFASS
jgi:hypothetical protein